MPTYLEKFAPELLPQINQKWKKFKITSEGIVELKAELKRIGSIRRLPQWYRHMIRQCITTNTND